MTKTTSMSRLPLLLVLPLLAGPLFGQGSASSNFYIHAFHKEKLNGELECSLCHVAVKEGSVTLKRPGHDQCIVCHSDDFNTKLNQKICEQCHTSFPPTSSADLVPFPRYKGSRAILFDFSHARTSIPKLASTPRPVSAPIVPFAISSTNRANSPAFPSMSSAPPATPSRA